MQEFCLGLINIQRSDGKDEGRGWRGWGIRWEESKAVIIETDVFRMKTQDMCGTKKQFSITDMLNYYQV